MDHQAAVPWNRPQQQYDWVDQILGIEQWLERTIGVKEEAWTWVDNTTCACIRFKRAKDATLFLLVWS